uniref:E3 ubiquitin-protein ligase n=1 Tax=Meloidogyne hapla TaxID=6305 RepID=A0A1I8B2K2_MELHA
MSSHSRAGNPNDEKSAVGASSGPQHRKRQSPNNQATIGLTFNNFISNSTKSEFSVSSASSAAGGVRDPSLASSSKLRKVSTAVGSSNTEKGKEVPSKAGNKQEVTADEGAAGTSTGSRRPARELSALIQPFPDRVAISEERLTRSKSKALQKAIANEGTSSSSTSKAGKSDAVSQNAASSSNTTGSHSKTEKTKAAETSTTSKSGALGDLVSAAAAVHNPVTSEAFVNAAAALESRASRFVSLLQQQDQTTSTILPSSFLTNTSNALASSPMYENKIQQPPQILNTSNLGLPSSSANNALNNYNNFPSPLMSSSLLPSTMAAAVHQQSLIASTAAAVAASDFAVSFASQLAAAAAVVGGVATSTIRTDSSASAVTVDSSASTTTNCDMQHLDRSSSINNSIVDSGNGCPMEVDQPVGRTPLVSTISPSLIGINRSSLDDISAGSHHHHSQHQSRAVAAAMLGAKSQRAAGFLSTIVPRMQHLLNSTTNSSTTGTGSAAARAGYLDTIVDASYSFSRHHHATTPAMLSIVEGLKSSNEIRQSEAASELAEMLLLGNEESLPNMPIVEIVQALCGLLQKDDNFELMLTAARCITNMQEALPRALPAIVETIPLLLAKLKRIEYIDVAEQSLIALEVMSRRNGKQILLQGGIASAISHVDFFSLPSQRLCYQIWSLIFYFFISNFISFSANCALNVSQNEFHLVKDCLPDLTQRLVYVDDKRCVESICTFFNRIIENMRQNADRLRQITGAGYEFLQNVQKMLAIQPSNITPGIYLSLIKSIRYIVSQCSDAALALVRMDFGNTIRTLIGPERTDVPSTPSESSGDLGEKISNGINSRPSVQIKEIITLIGQLVENLPRGGEEVVSLLHLIPLLVDIGSNSTCSQLRNESLNVMSSIVKMVDKVDTLEPILRNYCDIPLAVFITQMLSSNRNLGTLLSSLQLSRALLDKLPQLYIPLFESEGVFHETRRLMLPIESPTIDRKPNYSRSSMAEHLLEGLVNSSQSGGGTGVRVIIPPISMHQDRDNQGHQQNLQQQQDLVCKEAKQIADKFATDYAARKFSIKEPHRARKLFDKLTALANKLRSNKDYGAEPIMDLRNLLLEQEITSFQFNQSGIPDALVTYLCNVSGAHHQHSLHADSVGADKRHYPFESLVTKLTQTIGTVEQFQVRVTNLSGIFTNGSGSSSLAQYQSALLGGGAGGSLFSTTLRGAQALRFFQMHQIRINLRRHAIRQYTLPRDDDTVETIPSSIWLTTHTIYYNSTQNESNSGETVAGGTTSKSKENPSTETSQSKPVDEPSSVSAMRTRNKLVPRAVGAVKKAEKVASSSSAPNLKETQVYKTGNRPPRESPLDLYLRADPQTKLNDPSMSCLVLMKILYGLNSFWWELFETHSNEKRRHSLPISHTPFISSRSFLNSKLNSKVSRQLSDFLTVATQQVPKWTIDLMNNFPFIFSFSTRRSFLFCTSFGRDRALMHLVSEVNNDDGHEGATHDANSRLIPRLERRKVSIKRNDVLKDAQQILTQMNTSKAMLEVGFEGEVGTGFGPTLEFYSTLSRALQKNSLSLWDGKVRTCPEEEKDGSGDDDYIFSSNGLYPKMLTHPLSSKQNELRLKRFEFIGRLLGQALIDSRMLDLPLSPAFFKWLIGEEESLGTEDFEKLEPTIFRSLREIVQTEEQKDFESLDVYFVYPGEPSMELCKGGKNLQVAMNNCKQFLELVCYWRLVEGVRSEMEAVRRGFRLVINKDSLRIFSSDEMELLFCGSAENDERIWSKSALQHALRPDHGYNYDSAQIKWLITMLCSYKHEKRRRFLQFVTGSPRLPIGGFRGLNPPLTVVKKTATCVKNEEELPSAMTCYNYLKIPPYETYETFVSRFGSFLCF